MDVGHRAPSPCQVPEDWLRVLPPVIYTTSKRRSLHVSTSSESLELVFDLADGDLSHLHDRLRQISVDGVCEQRVASG